MKESILNDAKKGSGDTTNAGNETTGATNTATTPATSTNNTTTTTRSNDTYVYGVDILTVLAIGVRICFTYNTFQPFKKLINDDLAAQHEQKQDQQPKKTSYALEKYIINEYF